MKSFKIKLYKIKNSIKYYFKRNLDLEELLYCSKLIDDGYMSKKAYDKILERRYK